MIDRRARPAALLVLAVAVAGCLPERVGPGRSPAGGSGPTATPTTALPTGPSPSPSFVRPTPTPMPSFQAYIVKTGDSLNTIAHRFHTTARSIAFWNRATYPSLDPDSGHYSPNSIKVGWTLSLIPGIVFDETSVTPTPLPSASF